MIFYCVSWEARIKIRRVLFVVLFVATRLGLVAHLIVVENFCFYSLRFGGNGPVQFLCFEMFVSPAKRVKKGWVGRPGGTIVSLPPSTVSRTGNENIPVATN